MQIHRLVFPRLVFPRLVFSKLMFLILVTLILAIHMPAYFSPAAVISAGEQRIAPDEHSAEVIAQSGQHFTLGDYTVENNDWGKGNLIVGKDYTQQISFNKGSLQHGVTMKWAYPKTQGPPYVYGYPEIIWGNKLGYLGTMMHSNQIKDITNLSVDYSVAISGETDDFSVGIEIWTSNKPWGTPGAAVINELMVKVHGWQDGPGTLYKDGALTVLQAIHRNVNGHTFITLDTTADKLSGTINLYQIINDLVNAGVINRDDYISGVELGAEIKQGSGSMQIDHFSVTETLAEESD
jgi:hypothetical protein